MTSRAASLMELLGLSEDELCLVLDTDALTLLSGQADAQPELKILLDLLAEPTEAVGPTRLRQWLRASGPDGRPVELLLARNFAAFEDALDGLSRRGFVIRVDRGPTNGG